MAGSSVGITVLKLEREQHLAPWGQAQFPLAYSGTLPKTSGDLDGVDAGLLPPSLLVADSQRTMMRAAERDGELVTGFAAGRTRLHKSEVMGMGRLPAAQEAWLLGPIDIG